jgi:hypothetical protein
MGSPDQTINDMADVADDILGAQEISDAERAQLVQEIRGLADQVKKYMPEPGDVAMVSYLTSRGYEGYQYRASAQPMWDSSKPLALLKHVGGNPTLLLATRSKEDPEDYDRGVEWLKRVAVQVEKILQAKADPDDWARYQQIREEAVGLLERLDRANREHLLLAFQDGQSALVVDTSAQSKQWSNKMPESPNPLPMFELALVLSVSDADHLRQGATQYFDVVQDAIALAREIHPDQVPEFELPEPERRSRDDGGNVYSYALPEEWGVDSQIALNAGVTDNVAVVSLAPATTERLLRESPLEVDSSIDLERPAAVVSHFQIADVVEAIGPWIDYGFDVATGKLKLETEEDDESGADDEENSQQAAIAMQVGMVLPQVQQFLEVFTVIKSISFVTYEDDGVWVTHSETHLEDLE